MTDPLHPPPRLSRASRTNADQPISRLMRAALVNPDLISLAAGFVDPLTLPVDLVRQASTELLSRDATGQAALQYGTTAGYEPLRHAILTRQLQLDGCADNPHRPGIDRVVLTAGSNELLHLVSRTLLDPGDVVLCSSPTYFVFLATLQDLQARAVGVEADEQGIIPEALERQLERLERQGELGRVKAIYVVTDFDNPRSVCLNATRRERLVRIAEQWSRKQRIYLIDDQAYRSLRYEGTDQPSLLRYDSTATGDPSRVVLAGTFSKCFSPGIRIGWGILPEELVTPVVNQKSCIDFGSPNFNQHLMAQVVQVGWFDQHIERIRAAYRRKRDAMLDALQRHLGDVEGVRWLRPEGGLYVWLELPEPIDTGPDGPLLPLAVDAGVLYVPGEYGFPAEGPPVRRHALRLTFGVQPPDRIEQGIEALSHAIRQVLKT